MSFGKSVLMSNASKPSLSVNYFHNSGQSEQDLLEYQKMLERQTITNMIAPSACSKFQTIMNDNKNDEKKKISTAVSEINAARKSFSQAAAGKSTTSANDAINNVESELQKVEEV